MIASQSCAYQSTLWSEMNAPAAWLRYAALMLPRWLNGYCLRVKMVIDSRGWWLLVGVLHNKNILWFVVHSPVRWTLRKCWFVTYNIPNIWILSTKKNFLFIISLVNIFSLWKYFFLNNFFFSELQILSGHDRHLKAFFLSVRGITREISCYHL